MSKKPCIMCKRRPREVPDRNCMPGRPIKKVCRQCHADRIRGDLRLIIELDRECELIRLIEDSQVSP